MSTQRTAQELAERLRASCEKLRRTNMPLSDLIPLLQQAADALAASTAPAQQAEPTMSDALAAGDGTLHGAIDYWQERALKAEEALKKEKS